MPKLVIKQGKQMDIINNKKIGLIGFGKAGRAVAATILQNKDFVLEWVYRKKATLEKRSVAELLGIESKDPSLIYCGKSISMNELLNQYPVDFIIDFSENSGVYEYGRVAALKKVKIISAISHYENQEKKLLKELSSNTVVFWSPNITLGVNYLLLASKFLKRIAPFADIEVVEEHFKQKEGISGTALKIAEALDINAANINSVRAGGIVGKHEVIFGFPFQTVRLIHESISREAFGTGVLFAAKSLIDKNSGLFTFEDLLLPYFSIS